MGITAEAKEFLADCVGNTRRVAEYLFPSRFTRVWTNLHLQMFDLLDNSDNPRKAIIAPRGLGKTSIANLVLPAKAALFLEHRYIVPVSCTSTLATQQSENLKKALVNNKIITGLFGDMKTNVFNKEQYVLYVAGEEVCIMPRGAGQQVRGILFGDHRMQLGIADDLEDPDNMDSEDMRLKKKKWFYNDFMKAVDNYERPPKWQIIVVNTLLHEDSLAADLLNNPDWDTLELEICDDDLNSKIPEWLSDEDIRVEYERAEREGNVGGFYREFRNKPNVGGRYATFSKEFFRYYEEHEIDFVKSADIETFIIIDPAKKGSETGEGRIAETAIVGVSVNFRTNQVFFRDVVHGKFHIDKAYDEAFAMLIRLQAKVIGIEVTGLEEYATYPLVNEMVRRNLMVQVVELRARGGDNESGKTTRIKGLRPFYKMGLVYHNKANCSALESQLLSFPNAKYKDVMDAASYVVQMMEKSGRHMLPVDVEGNPLPEEISDYSFQQVEKELFDIEESYSSADRAIGGVRLI